MSPVRRPIKQAPGFNRKRLDARKALARGNYREAASLLEGLQVNGHNGPNSDEPTLSLITDIAVAQRNALLAQAKYEDDPITNASGVFSIVTNLLGDVSNPGKDHDIQRFARVNGYKWNTQYRDGKHQLVINAHENPWTPGPTAPPPFPPPNKLLEQVEDLGDLSLSRWLNFQLCLAYHAHGNYKKAIEHAGNVVENLVGDLTYERFGAVSHPSVLARWVKAWSHSELGHFVTANSEADRAVEIVNDAPAFAQDPFDRTVAPFAKGFVQLNQGAFDSAVANLEASYIICNDTDENKKIHVRIPTSLAALGFARALHGFARGDAGSVDDGFEELGNAKIAAEAINVTDPKHQPYHALRLAWMELVRILKEPPANPDPETDINGAVLPIATRPNGVEQGSWSWVTFVDAHVHLKDGNVSPATETLIDNAKLLAVNLGMEPLAAHCQWAKGIFFHIRGNPGDAVLAAQEIGEAKSSYARLGMDNDWNSVWENVYSYPP